MILKKTEFVVRNCNLYTKLEQSKIPVTPVTANSQLGIKTVSDLCHKTQIGLLAIPISQVSQNALNF